MRRLMRWMITIAVAAMGFSISWWLFGVVFNLDNQSAIGVATVVAGLFSSPLAWWAGTTRNDGESTTEPHSSLTTRASENAWNMPARNMQFTGRAETLDQLFSHDGTKTVTLRGIGGVGKTQLALEYVWRNSADYRIGWWVAAEISSLIEPQLADLALDLNLVPPATAVTAAVRKLRAFLRVNAGWILVFDNAESPAAILQMLPGGPGHIIITSRHRDFAQATPTIAIETMSRYDSVTLIQKHIPTLPTELADGLANALGDLPLAMTQAVGYMTQTGISEQEYENLLGSHPHSIMSEGPTGGYPRPLSNAVSLTLDRLGTGHPSALQLLRVLSLLAPEPIPTSWLIEASTTPNDGPMPSGRAEVAHAIAVLVNYGVINAGTYSIQMHRLVRALVANTIDGSLSEEFRSSSYLLLSSATEGDPSNPAHWPDYRALRPHIEVLLPYRSADKKAWTAIDRFVRFLYYVGDFEGCRKFAREAVDHGRVSLGETDRDWLKVSKLLGYILIVTGRIQEGSDVVEESARRSVEAYGSDSRETIDARSLLAVSLRARGMFRDAHQIDQEIVGAARRFFGPDDPETLAACHNLGVGLRNLGLFREAVELDIDTYNRRASAIGEDHVESLRTLNAVAIDEREAGHYDAALSRQTATYQKYVVKLGKENPETLIAARNLAVCMRRAGNYRAALEVSAETLASSVNLFGETHPYSHYIAFAHAVNLRCARRLEEARNVTASLVEQYARVFGPDHPTSNYARTQLGVTLCRQGEIDSALRILTETCDALARRVGDEHPYVLYSAVELSNCYALTGDFLAARQLGVGTLDALTRVLGASHPFTLAQTVNVCLDAYHCGETRSLHDHRAAVLALSAVIGDAHPMVRQLTKLERFSPDVDVMPW